MTEIAHTGWKVVSIDPSAYIAAADGSPVYGSRIRFQTGLGTMGSVFLRNEDLTPANAGALIDVQAALLDKVATMQAEPGTVVV